MGKGTIGINPFYHDGQVMSRTAVAGILSVLVAFTDSKSCEYLPPVFGFITSPRTDYSLLCTDISF